MASSLQVSWAKTKIQSMGPYTPTADAVIDGHNVESVRSFCYLGGTIHLTDSGGTDVRRRIGSAAAAVNSLARIWSQDRLTLAKKLRIYQTCILSVLLYGAETWSLFFADTSRLQAFHMRCQRRILGLRWQDRVTNRFTI